jgi:CheY-like chemotaxis protein
MKRVLIVDDEPHVLRVLQMSLERAGFQVDAAPNGESGLEKILGGRVDAVVADIEMPRMNGRELCEKIQELVPERGFPIVIMTSMVDREHREWTAKIPDLTFMEKPLSPRKLVRWLEESLGQG